MPRRSSGNAAQQQQQQQQKSQSQPQSQTTPSDPLQPQSSTTVAQQVRLARTPQLKKVFDKSLSASTKNITYENFAACFPTPTQHVPTAMRQLWKTFLEKFESELTESYDQIVEDRNTYKLLDELDMLLHEAKQRKAVSTTTTTPVKSEGDEDAAADADKEEKEEQPKVVSPMDITPSEIVAAHVLPYLRTHEAKLKAAIEERERENEALIKKREAQKKEMEELAEVMKNKLKVIEQTAESLKDLGDFEDLEKETDSMDVGAG